MFAEQDRWQRIILFLGFSGMEIEAESTGLTPGAGWLAVPGDDVTSLLGGGIGSAGWAQVAGPEIL